MELDDESSQSGEELALLGKELGGQQIRSGKEGDARGVYTSLAPSAKNDSEKQQQHLHEKPTCSNGVPSSIVQFLRGVWVVQGGSVDMAIMRIGNKDHSCEFTWRTKEKSALSGQQFVHAEGTITMGPGQSDAVLSVQVLDDPTWNTTVEFEVLLENATGCELDDHFWKARVKCMDADDFPTNDFREQISKGEEGIEAINEFKLFRCFIRLMSVQEGIIWRTAVSILIGVFRNLYEYLSLILSIYMVDQVFNFESEEQLIIPGNRLSTAIAVALLGFVPNVIFFLLEIGEVHMDISGKLREALTKHLLRKYMNYSSKSREEVNLTDMVSSMTQDASEVSAGYTRCLAMLRLAGQIFIGIYFTMEQNPGAWWAVVGIPCILSAWGAYRYKGYVKAAQNQDDQMSEMTAFVEDILSKLGFIANYGQRANMTDGFGVHLSRVKESRILTREVSEMCILVPKLMGPALVAAYICIGGSLVLQKELNLGKFLATIKVFGSMCSDFAHFYGLAMDIIGTFPALEGLTVVLNKSSELRDVMNFNVTRDEQTLIKRKQTQPHSEVPPADRLEISLEHVEFAFRAGEVRSVAVFKDLCFSAPQGAIVGIREGLGHGRSTLMALLNGNLYPQSGVLFVPSHLRTLLVTHEIVMLNVPLWQNVSFGSGRIDPYRVEDVLKHFHMFSILEDVHFSRDLKKQKRIFDGEDPTQIVEDGSRIDAMGEFSETERAWVHLVRAFLVNPEILLVHRPFTNFHERRAVQSIKEGLRTHRDNRGLYMPPESKLRRRPRTVFITPDSCSHHTALLDIIWDLPVVGGESKQFSQREFAELMGESKVRRSDTSTKYMVPVESQRSPGGSQAEHTPRSLGHSEVKHGLTEMLAQNKDMDSTLWPLRRVRVLPLKQGSMNHGQFARAA